MEKLAAVVWGMPTMVLMLAVGISFTIRTNWVQLRKLRQSICMLWRNTGKSKPGVSSFQAVCTALAATVGTGNIAGVAGALALGGPGAVFWMWLSALFGMATKYAEVVLAIRYRKRGADGQWLGGPMYYIANGLGRSYRWMARIFAFFAVLASLGMGNLAQIHTISEAVCVAAAQVVPHGAMAPVTAITAVTIAVVIILITMGGAERIGHVMAYLMPVLAAVYLFSAAAVIAVHWDRVGAVFASVFRSAFSVRSVAGGSAGIGIRQAMRWGISRGVFSNEAGLGSAPIAHAAAEAKAEEQGLFGIFEVFLDTIVLCTLTAVSILVSGVSVPYGNAAGAELATAALETVWGSGASVMQAAVLALLALGSMVSWNLYGSRCAQYLWGNGGMRTYQLLYPGVVVLGAAMKLSVVWSFSDLCNGLMALPNLAALWLLRKQVGGEPEV